MTKILTISVVIPVFDKLDVLHTVLSFFGKQSFSRNDFEVIVVDDGSVERIGESLARRSFPFALNVIIQRNLGRAAARNSGVRQARGDVILFCDADRLPDPDLVSIHAAFHKRWPRSAAVGIPWDCFIPFEKIKLHGVDLLPDMRRLSRAPTYYRILSKLLPFEESQSSISWAGFLVGNSSVRRSDVLQSGGFDEDLTTWGVEHFEMAFRLSQKCGISVRYLHAGGNYHIPHPRSRSYFLSGIDASIEALRGKESHSALRLLRRFLIGELSLQDLEESFCGCISEQIATREPLFIREFRS